jgi:PAS domain S-box-containing protein
MLVGSVDALWRVVEKCCLGLYDYNKSTKKMVRNKNLYTMYGIGLELVGTEVAEHLFLPRIHPDDVKRVQSTFQECLQSEVGSYNMTYRVFHEDGKMITLRSCAITHHNADGTQSIVGMAQDISEICRMQQEQADKEAATARLNALLAAEIKHKEEMYRLLRTISHEVRNPLHGILGNTQALLDLVWQAEQAAGVTRQRAAADVTVSSGSPSSSSKCTCCCTCGARASTVAGASPAAVTAFTSSTSSSSISNKGTPEVLSQSARPAGRSTVQPGPVQTHVQRSSSCSSADVAADSAADVAPIPQVDCARARTQTNSSSCDDEASTKLNGLSSNGQSNSQSNGQSRLSARCLHRAARAKKRGLTSSSSDTASSSGSSSSAQQLQQQGADYSSSSSMFASAVKGMVAEIHECALHQVE